jgi:large subunit ribosomal protein L13Ae
LTVVVTYVAASHLSLPLNSSVARESLLSAAKRSSDLDLFSATSSSGKRWREREFWKNIRGMLPHKEARGAAALASLRLFDGIPYPYDQKKRMVVPNALKVLRMKSHRNFTVLRDIAKLAGWAQGDLIDTLETRRKAKSAKFYAASQAKVAARAAASKDKSVSAFNGALTKLGF